MTAEFNMNPQGLPLRRIHYDAKTKILSVLDRRHIRRGRGPSLFGRLQLFCSSGSFRFNGDHIRRALVGSGKLRDVARKSFVNGLR